MSQPSAVASASFARSSPRCQLWTSLPRLPRGFSRLWSGPATKPSSEIDMWQVVSGIGVLQVIAICKRRHRTAREMWWQNCKHHLRHRDTSGQRTPLGYSINAAVEVIGDHRSLLVLPFVAAVLGSASRLLPARNESRPTCKGGWSPATSVSQKWAILVRFGGHPCKTAPFGMTFRLDSAQPERNVPRFPPNARRIRSITERRLNGATNRPCAL